MKMCEFSQDVNMCYGLRGNIFAKDKRVRNAKRKYSNYIMFHSPRACNVFDCTNTDGDFWCWQ